MENNNVGRLVDLLYSPLKAHLTDKGQGFVYLWERDSERHNCTMWYDLYTTPLALICKDAATEAGKGWDVYLSCAASTEKGEGNQRTSLSGKDDKGRPCPRPAWVMAFYMDVDTLEDTKKAAASARVPATKADAVRDLTNLAVPPSVIVDSGHGVHAWWLLDKPEYIAPDFINKANTALQDFMRGIQGELTDAGLPYGSLDSASDINRVLRVDGCMNYKDTAHPLPTSILYEDEGKRYSLSDLRPICDKGAAITQAAAASEFGHRSCKVEELPGYTPDGTLTAEEIAARLDKARTSRTPKGGITRGAAFRTLYDQGTGVGIPWLKDPSDESTVDQSLFNQLAFFMGGDRIAIKTAALASARYREKWDKNRTYVDRCIEKALEGVDAFYIESKPKAQREVFTCEALEAEMTERGISVELDVITKTLSCAINGEKSYSSTGRPLSKESLIARLYSDLVGKYKGFNLQVLRLYLDEIVRQHEINPVVEWLESLQWDKVDHLAALYDLMGLAAVDDPESELSRKLVYRWLLQAVGQVYSTFTNLIQPEGVLVLQGAEHIGKTTLLTKLAVKPEWSMTGAHIDFDDKDTVRRVGSHFITELGEVDRTMRGTDSGQLKAYITKSFDEYRLAFGREDEQWPRTATLCASVNPPDYLVDDSADTNRRWWTVPLDKVMPYDSIVSFDFVGLWAQVMWMYRNGARGRLTDEELEALGRRNAHHRKGNKGATEVSDILAQAAEHPDEYEQKWLSATKWKAIYPELMRYEAVNIGKALSVIPEVKNRMLHGTKVYLVPTYKHHV